MRCLLERELKRELSTKLITAFICDFYSGVQRGQSVSVVFSTLVVFVLLFDRLLLGFCVLLIILLLCIKSHWNHSYTCLVSNLVHPCPCENFELRHPYAVNACIYSGWG